jgi:hypothetical protein
MRLLFRIIYVLNCRSYDFSLTLLIVMDTHMFFPSTEFKSRKTDRYDITEILLKVALNTINQNQTKPNFMNQY